jgi:hypothetical protein
MKKRKCRKFEKEERRNSRSATNVISVIQILRMRWSGCVAYVRDKNIIFLDIIQHPVFI